MPHFVKPVPLFIVASLLGGAGGAVGSILGNAAGRTGLFVGGVVGGILAAVAAAGIARWRRWIDPSRMWSTAVGGAVGFIAAALVATNTLASPVGPVLSTLLVGSGALLGAGWRRGSM